MAAQRGTKWQGRIRTPEKYYRPTFDTKQEAELWEAQARIAIAKGDPVPDPQSFMKNGGYTLKEFIRKYGEGIWEGKANYPQSMMNCKGFIKFFGESKLITDISPIDIEDFVQHCKTELRNSDRTINRKMSTLRMLLKKAKRLGLIQKLPEIEHRKEGRGRTRFLSDHEEDLLLKSAKSHPNPEVYARIIFMLDTGARDGEVRNLTWDDIDLSKGRVTFWKTKTDRPRTLPLTQRVQEALKRSKDQGHIKPFPMSYTTFLETWNSLLDKMGMARDKTLVPYVLRHTCATKLVRRGVDIRRVKDWMGHTNIVTTMVYAHLAPNDLESCVSVLEA